MASSSFVGVILAYHGIYEYLFVNQLQKTVLMKALESFICSLAMRIEMPSDQLRFRQHIQSTPETDAAIRY